MNLPKVFISYSHDSKEHKGFVRKLATSLRDYNIDADMDTWGLKPGDDLPTYMEKNLHEADFILVVCTKNYVEKANKGKGGVGYEKMILSASLLKDINTSKIIPIIREWSAENIVPRFLETKLYIDFTEDKNYESSFEELGRHILNEPEFLKPPIGKKQFASTENKKKELDTLLRDIFGKELANELLSKKNSEVPVILNQATISELEHFSEQGFIRLRSTGSTVNMGAGNKVGNHIEELKRPYALGHGFVLSITNAEFR